MLPKPGLKAFVMGVPVELLYVIHQVDMLQTWRVKLLASGCERLSVVDVYADTELKPLDTPQAA